MQGGPVCIALIRRQSLRNPAYQTLACRPKVQMSGSSKVEMSAFPAQCRDGWTPHVEHEGAGSPAGPDADRRAAPDAPARGGTCRRSSSRSEEHTSELQSRSDL